MIVDIKRLKKHYETYEPTLNELRHKYESAMKEKMLMRLERDRMAARLAALEAQVLNWPCRGEGKGRGGCTDSRHTQLCCCCCCCCGIPIHPIHPGEGI